MTSSILIGYLARLLSVGSGIIILPLVLRGLSDFEFNMWIVFSTAFLFQNVLDFGVTPTISRYFGYARAKKSNNKTDTEDWKNTITPEVIYHGAKIAYLLMTVITSVFCIIFYYLYIKPLELESGVSVTIGWFFIASALILNIYFLSLNSVLQGYERVIEIHYANIFSNVVFLVLGYVSYMYEMGLLGLTISRFASVLSHRIYCLYGLYFNPIDCMSNKVKPKADFNILKKIYHQSAMIGIGCIGGYLSNRSLVFIVTGYFTVSAASEFNIMAMLYTTLLSIALVATNTLLPTLSKNIFSGDIAKARKVSKQMYGFGLLTVLFGSLFIMIPGTYFLNLIGSNITLPNFELIVLFSILYLLEINYQISTNICSAFNEVRFIKSLIITGTLSLAVILFSLSVFKIKNVEYVVIIQLTGQLIFNYWYWPFKAKRFLKTGLCCS